MTLRVGDIAFGRNGQPAVITEKSSAKSELKVSSDPKAIQKKHPYGYINGLKPEERTDFLSVMGDIAEIEEPREKVGVLQSKIQDIKEDPRQHHLVGYLESELFHLMNLHKISPREYTIPFHG
jgi:hypothetical protein